jgi:hypothetical protein
MLIFASACGVKGDILPPEKPPVLGRGKPTYRRASEKVKLVPQAQSDNDESAEEAEEDK